MDLRPARHNHAIWNAPAKGEATIPLATLRLHMGQPLMRAHPTLWCVRHADSGAHLKVWCLSKPDSATDPHIWRVAWIDGPKHRGSGRALAATICGEAAGGQLERF